MPNKRSDQKKIISAYIGDDLKQSLADLAAREGKSLTDIVTELIKEKVEANGRKSNRRSR